MAVGPGRYDPECTEARISTNAKAVILIVIGGDKGNGFSCQIQLGFEAILAKLPDILRDMARQIEESGDAA